MTPLELSLLEQGSELWIQARVGLVTASRAADATDSKIVRKELVETAKRENYRYELICERVTGQPYPRYVSQEMQWGRDQEAFARAAYELERDILVETCGFIVHPKIPNFGASPDGLVGDDGLIQIKCPTTKTHMETILGGVAPIEHHAQMLAELACTGRKWCDFVSYDPRLVGKFSHLQLFIKRFTPDPKLIAVLESEIRHFNYEIENVLAALPGKPQGIVIAMDQVNTDEMEF